MGPPRLIHGFPKNNTKNTKDTKRAGALEAEAVKLELRPVNGP